MVPSWVPAPLLKVNCSCARPLPSIPSSGRILYEDTSSRFLREACWLPIPAHMWIVPGAICFLQGPAPHAGLPFYSLHFPGEEIEPWSLRAASRLSDGIWTPGCLPGAPRILQLPPSWGPVLPRVSCVLSCSDSGRRVADPTEQKVGTGFSAGVLYRQRSLLSGPPWGWQTGGAEPEPPNQGTPVSSAPC